MSRDACPPAACFSNSRRGAAAMREQQLFHLALWRCGEYSRAASDLVNMVCASLDNSRISIVSKESKDNLTEGGMVYVDPGTIPGSL